jgi:hypothetical protein
MTLSRKSRGRRFAAKVHLLEPVTPLLAYSTFASKQGQDILWMYGIPAMMNYQLHMISRIDCATQAMCNKLKKHTQFDFALKTKLEWSKNVMEEQDAPWQAILTSNEHTHGVHLSLALCPELLHCPSAPFSVYLF